MPPRPGERFKKALEEEKPLQIVGVPNSYTAIMAKAVGFKALYLSGAGVANSAFGLPDIGLTTLDEIKGEAERIVDAVDLPLLVDIDTGWASPLMAARAVKSLARLGVAAVQIEDQPYEKRCGHLPNKEIIPIGEMKERLSRAAGARGESGLLIMARTDALASEGVEGCLERLFEYKEAGADLLFLEAGRSLEEYARVKKEIKLPLLANLTEFGVTPAFSAEELTSSSLDMVLYPLSLNRVMNKAALEMLQEIRKNKSSQALMQKMETREELYRFLKYNGGKTG